MVETGQGAGGGGGEPRAIGLGPCTVGLGQAVDGVLGGGQRCAQVVADGVQHGGTGAVGLGDRARLFGLFLQTLLAQGDGGLGRVRLQYPPGRRGELMAAQDQRQSVADRDVGVAFVGVAHGSSPTPAAICHLPGSRWRSRVREVPGLCSSKVTDVRP